ncbi:MAG: hypothetical protein NUV67_00625, partial [archaeon]|nr:hypothetical protein [archaeon]
MKKTLTALLLLLIAVPALAAGNAYWLRGNDFTSFIDGQKANFITSTPPSISSSETIFSPNSDGLIGTWYTSLFPQGLQLQGEMALWQNGYSSSAPLEWELFEYDPAATASKLLTSGTIPQGSFES